MKKTYVVLLVLSLVICAAVLLDTAKSSEPVLAVKNTTVVIDAGHGGEDGGASSPDGVLEKDLNLSIAKKCESILELFGINVIMTRTEDRSVDDGTGITIAARKANDIRKRMELANSVDGALVSIHMNSFPDSKYWGTQCFYAPSEGSTELGETIQNFCGNVCTENVREAKLIDRSVYLLNHAEVPAVIVECGFLSNPEEARKLSDDEYQKKLSSAICTGIISFINKAE